MAQVLNTPAGPLLCSRINAGALEHGDLVISDDEQRTLWITGSHRDYTNGHAVLHIAGTYANWRIRLGINTPVWRAVGARAAGPIS